MRESHGWIAHRRRSPISIAALIAFAQCILGTALADDARDACRADLIAKAPPGNLSYQRRGQFCEGVIAEEVGGGVEVVGFQIFRTDAKPLDQTTIPIYLLAPPSQRAMATLLGVSRVDGVSYRLDAIANSEGLFLWDWSRVAKPLGLRSQDVAVAGVLVNGSHVAYLPVTFGVDRATPQQLVAALELRATQDIGPLFYRVRDDKNSAWTAVAPDGINQGHSEVIRFAIPSAWVARTIELKVSETADSRTGKPLLPIVIWIGPT